MSSEEKIVYRTGKRTRNTTTCFEHSGLEGVCERDYTVLFFSLKPSRLLCVGILHVCVHVCLPPSLTHTPQVPTPTLVPCVMFYSANRSVRLRGARQAGASVRGVGCA
jgi:hypothetical protein